MNQLDTKQKEHTHDDGIEFSDAKYEEKFKFFETLCQQDVTDDEDQLNTISKRSIPVQSLNLNQSQGKNFQKPLDQNIYNETQASENFALQKMNSSQPIDKVPVDDKMFSKPKKIKAKEKKEQILSLDEEEEESEHPFDESFSSGSDFYEKMSYTDKSKIDPSQQQIEKPEIYSEIMHYKSSVLKHQYPEYYEYKKQEEFKEEEDKMKQDLQNENIDIESDEDQEEEDKDSEGDYEDDDDEDEDNYITKSLLDKFESYEENSEEIINQIHIYRLNYIYNENCFVYNFCNVLMLRICIS